MVVFQHQTCHGQLALAVPGVTNGAILVIACTLQGGEISSKEPRRPDLAQGDH